MRRSRPPRASALRLLVILAVVAVFHGGTQGLFRPFVAPYAASLGADPFLVGVVVAAAPVSGVLLAVPMGAAADIFGGRRILVCGAVVVTLGALLIGSAPLIIAVLAGQLVIGMGTLCLNIALQSIASLPVGEADIDARRVTVYSTAALVGMLIAPVVGGAAIDLWSYQVAFLSVAGAGVLAIGASALLPERGRVAPADQDAGEQGQQRAQRSRRPGLGSYRGAGALLRDRTVLLTVIASGLGAGLSNLRSSFVPLYFAEIGWSASLIGVVMSVTALAALSSRVMHPWLDRHVPAPYYVGGALVLGALGITASVWTASLPLIVASMAVSGFMLGTSNPVTLTLMARLLDAGRRGIGVGLRVTCNRLMMSVSPLLFGAVAAASSTRGALVSMSVLASGLGGYSIRGFRRRLHS